MGFRETGYFFLIVIVFFNIGLTFFSGQGSPSTYLNEHAGPGLQGGRINVGQIPTTNPQGETFVSSDTTTQTTPASKVANDLYPDVLSLINDLLFASATAVEKSGIPYPLDFIFALVIKIIVSGYAFIFGLDIVNAVFRGGSVQ